MLAKTQFRLNRLAVQAGDKGVQTRSPHKLMLAKKSIKLRLNLRKRHYQLTFIFYQMIKIMFNSPYNNDVVFDSALQLCSLYNDAVSCAMQFHASSGAQVCSRFFPPLLITPKKLDISTILQVSSINPLCSHSKNTSLIRSFRNAVLNNAASLSSIAC